jgi:hypothetical protein
MLSEERLAHWKELAKHPGLATWRARTACRLPPDDEHAVLLHEWNAAIACSLMMSFQIFEVSLRNHMHDALTAYFKTSSWWGQLQGRLWIASSNLLAPQKDDINKAIEVSARLTPGGVISALSFGFWLSLIGVGYDNPSAGVTLWRNCLHAVFDKAGKIGRKDAYAALEHIIRLRNKCAHHEPIVTLNIDAEHTHLVSFARRFSRATAEWITQTSLTPHIIKPDWYHALRVSGRLIGSLP